MEIAVDIVSKRVC